MATNSKSSTPSALSAAQVLSLRQPHSLGVFDSYAKVQKAVDHLADNSFPVENTMIVGTDLKLIERVTGRLTWSRVLLSGALSGAWIGLFISFLMVIVYPADWSVFPVAISVGVVTGIIWSAFGYWMSGGQRDFTSFTTTVPMSFELMVENENAQQAKQILTAAGILRPEPTQATPRDPRLPQYGLPAESEK
ncbi:general stress protein [Dermabacteraceae bacterium P13101]|nr:hypothetical protein [Dermabacteraceae bacterium TAE3-ERU5]